MFSEATAVNLAKKMEHLDISWFEEPVVPEDIQVSNERKSLLLNDIYMSLKGYSRVKAKTSIPIAGGECSFMR